MKYQKFLLVTVCACLILALAVISLPGCSSSTPAPSTPSPAKTSATATTSAPATSTQPAQSPAAKGVIKIGHIRPLTGNLATTSDLMLKSFDLAFQQVGYQVAGKQIQIIVGDSKGDPATAIDVARKMVENDKVDMIVGATYCR